MENATHRHLMNPALTSDKGYFSLPILGELSMGLESNLLLSDFLYPSENGGKLITFLHPDVDATTFLSNLDASNYLNADIRTSILSMGLNTKIGYLTFDVASHANISMNLPYELFSFMKLGMTNGQGNEYNIRNLNIGTGAYVEASLGYARNIMDNFRVGAKLKYLAGIANVKAIVQEMEVNMSQEQWSISSNAKIDVYGKGFTFKKDSEDQSISGIEFDSPGMGGSGFAIDLGVVYSPIENLDISLGIIDLGSITYKKENVLHATSSGSVEFSGLDGIGTDSTANQAVEDQIEQLKDDAMNMFKFKETTSTDAKQKLYTTVNAGAQYKLYKEKIGVGLLYTGRFMDGKTFSELMASATYNPIKWVQIAGSYSFIHSNFKTFGLALNLSPGFVNLFLACDYIVLKRTPQYIPLNTASTNFQFGLAITLGK